MLFSKISVRSVSELDCFSPPVVRGHLELLHALIPTQIAQTAMAVAAHAPKISSVSI